MKKETCFLYWKTVHVCFTYSGSKLPQCTCMLDSMVCECMIQPLRWDLFTYVFHNKKT